MLSVQKPKAWRHNTSITPPWSECSIITTPFANRIRLSFRQKKSCNFHREADPNWTTLIILHPSAPLSSRSVGNASSVRQFNLIMIRSASSMNNILGSLEQSLSHWIMRTWVILNFLAFIDGKLYIARVCVRALILVDRCLPLTARNSASRLFVVSVAILFQQFAVIFSFCVFINRKLLWNWRNLVQLVGPVVGCCFNCRFRWRWWNDFPPYLRSI